MRDPDLKRSGSDTWGNQNAGPRASCPWRAAFRPPPDRFPFPGTP